MIETSFHQDDRGGFARFFCRDELSTILKDRKICQINFSENHQKGTIRGMHFQNNPYAEMKLIRCLRGRVFDVAIDLRKGSETFLHFFSIELSEQNKKMIVIPEGFAHGFQVLEESSQLLYLHTSYYHPESEGGINPMDHRISIEWPLPVTEISEKDINRPYLDEDYIGIEI